MVRPSTRSITNSEPSPLISSSVGELALRYAPGAVGIAHTKPSERAKRASLVPLCTLTVPREKASASGGCASCLSSTGGSKER
jgi:hypothetical protein